jgi:hypothetical protein
MGSLQGRDATRRQSLPTPLPRLSEFGLMGLMKERPLNYPPPDLRRQSTFRNNEVLYTDDRIPVGILHMK